MKQVWVVAASAIARAGLAALIAEQTDQWQAVSLSDLPAWPSAQAPLPPDAVLLVGVAAELTGGLSAIADCPAPVVLLLEGEPAASLTALLQGGVQGILPLEATPAELVAALEAAAVGLVTLHPDLAERLTTAGGLSPGPAELPTPALTPREVEVLTLLAEGMGNKTIARRLTLSEHTVKFHISTIFAKLNVSSRTEAVTVGARLGLILL